MAYQRFKIADLGMVSATLATLATLPAKPSQVSQGGTSENTICDSQSVATVASVAGTHRENEFSEPLTVASVALGMGDVTPNAETNFVSFVAIPDPHYHDFFRPDPAGAWTDADWNDAFEERAAVLEFDGGWNRDAAESLARQYIDEQRALWKEVT